MACVRIGSGDAVSFRLADVFRPGCEEVLNRLTNDARLVGKVAFVSDAGERKGQFAIVEAEGVLIPLIVPVSQLRKVKRRQTAKAAGSRLARKQPAAQPSRREVRREQ